MYVCQSPQKAALLHTYAEKHKVTIHGAPRRRKAYIQCGVAWFPKETVTTLLSLPQCHAAFGMIPSTLAWVDQNPVSQHLLWQPPSGYTLHNCYSLPHDPGYSRVRIYDTQRYGQGVGFMGGAMGYNFIYFTMDTAAEISSEMSAAQPTATCHHHPVARFSSWRNQLLWSVFIHTFNLPSFSDFKSHRS